LLAGHRGHSHSQIKDIFVCLQVNDENVEDMSTAEVIDLLRKIRGTIGITVLRKSGPSRQAS
jgi:hypothetical protein